MLIVQISEHYYKSTNRLKAIRLYLKYFPIKGKSFKDSSFFINTAK